MTDDTQQPTAAPAADDKNPLDILEELLKDSGGGGAAAGGSKPAAQPSKPGELTEEELAQKRAEFEEIKAEQNIEDAEQLVKQKELLKTLTQTPAYQARVQQEEEKVVEIKTAEEASAGFEITQLDHDKI
ncbi:MAG: hypothetical protein GW946_03330 [Candidatus Pacebacteria bacterium]|nr:hypothetical protein [Candidatus Paceibacterota bacterium]